MLGVYATRIRPLIDGRAPFSFFDLINRIRGGPIPDPLHRICSLMRKMRVASLLQERLEPFPELEDEERGLTIRCGAPVPCTATRLTFFRQMPPSRSWHDLDDEDILGYAVIVRAVLPRRIDGRRFRSYVLEAVVRNPTFWIHDSDSTETAADVTNYYIHCSRNHKTTIGTRQNHREFNLHGTFFCQQNDLTHVCAHAALRMALNSSPRHRKKLTNQRINSILGVDHVTTTVGKYKEKKSVGVYPDEIIKVARHLGLSAHVADFRENPGVDYEAYIYPLVESGCPTFLGVANPNVYHALAVLGHTTNSDRWTPEARLGYGGLPISRYIPTSAWADHFIVSDDNYGTCVTLPTHDVRNIRVPRYNPNPHAALAIGIVPRGVELPGYLAEEYSSSLAEKLIKFFSEQPNVSKWVKRMQSNQLVCRTLLHDKQRYLTAMRDRADEKGNKLDDRAMNVLKRRLTSWFWVTELTIPHLFSGNKRKLGDIIIRADQPLPKNNFNSVVFLWLPGLAWSGRAIVQGQALFAWPLCGHVDLLRDCGSELPRLEW